MFMGEIDGIKVDEEKAQRLLQKLIMMENKNIMSKQFGDSEMVKKIKKMIEEEVECFKIHKINKLSPIY